MKHSFKVGDRVVATRSEPKGRVGSVVSVERYTGGYNVEVEFDGWTGGHGGSSSKLERYDRWYFCAGDDGVKCGIELVPSKPTLADDISFKPSTRRILAHLKARGSITVLEALAAYGTARIAPAIHDLREGGYSIETVKKADAGGHNYTRYVLAA